ncbi:hypothetical protein [Methanobrevibacter sp. V74]|uniref:hypothetical protein n=1 Tax=Methanobrevibacter sp. V74 TaxID=3064279 RepID=UPI002733C4A1|nr:hypothetical protein [Methanobrevibacter sp. V74]
MIFKQKTKIIKGASNTNAVKSSVPATIAKMLNVKSGDRIEWCVESINDELTVKVSKVVE